MKNVSRHAVLFLAVATLMLTLGVVALTPGASAQPRAGDDVWEYGRLRISGFDGVFTDGERVWWMDGPSNLKPVRAENSNRHSEIPPVELIHLNTLGEAGWEVVPTTAGQDGRSFLLRRRIR